MFKKSLLLVLSLVLAVFSCKLPDSSNSKAGNIVNKYPYWNVKISQFVVDPNGNKTPEEMEQIRKMLFRIDEKKFAVEALALIKLVVNTPEFEKAVMDAWDLYAHNHGEVENGAYNIKQDEIHTKKLDKKRLLQVIREANFSAKYIKIIQKDIFRGALGDLSYAYHGYKTYKFGNRIEGSYTRFEQEKREVFWLAASIFHEHLHNLGFHHTKSGVPDVPYTLGTNIMRDIGGIITGEKNPTTSEEIMLRDKYQKDLKELTAYYLSLYRRHFEKDTTYYDSRSYDPVEDETIVCSHS